ncbi:hypothetical protein, partial [Ellagibacter isourolithinifaciens]|uniref:hypothetical protein n=1 Tax=Ellagibacter isourolithinifaciens TaxID=2137581 RepID=UPI002E79C806
WYDFHCGRRLSLESDLSLSQILGDGHIRFTAASMRCGPYTNISDVINSENARCPMKGNANHLQDKGHGLAWSYRPCTARNVARLATPRPIPFPLKNRITTLQFQNTLLEKERFFLCPLIGID